MRQIKRSIPACLMVAVLLTGLLSVGAQAAAIQEQVTDVSQLETATMGVMTGSMFDAATKELLPNATIAYYNTTPDLAVALGQNKIDGMMLDEPIARYMQNQYPAMTWLDELVSAANYAPVFAKTDWGETLCQQMDEFLDTIKADGTLAQLDAEWFALDDAEKNVDSDQLTGENGTIKLAVEPATAPFSYLYNGEVVGYDIDMVAHFCQAYGYDLEIVSLSFSAIIPGVQSGTYDMGISCITITEERAESVLFSQPNYEGGLVVAVRDTTYVAEEVGFFDSLQTSFYKTFIAENRWEMILEGIGVTMFITLCATLIGTALGFGICMMRRSKNGLLRGLSIVYIRLVQGTPTVVLLMILFYVVFNGIIDNPVAVAIIGFSLNFGAYVSEMLRTGIDAVDNGQVEAAYAIGFTKVQTFVKIVLPQAAKHFLPVFQGEMISMLKMTSVVGYIAIQDLTKMSDLIRASTYESFFPLIATALIYFGLSYILSLLLNAISFTIDPRKGKHTLKGVKLS